jgi:glycine hydroxymethyltransferase
MKEDHMQFVVNMIDNVLMNADDENIIKGVRRQVNEFMSQFSLYPELS